jgi:hypothetical protein
VFSVDFSVFASILDVQNVRLSPLRSGCGSWRQGTIVVLFGQVIPDVCFERSRPSASVCGKQLSSLNVRHHAESLPMYIPPRDFPPGLSICDALQQPHHPRQPERLAATKEDLLRASLSPHLAVASRTLELLPSSCAQRIDFPDGCSRNFSAKTNAGNFVLCAVRMVSWRCITTGSPRRPR